MGNFNNTEYSGGAVKWNGRDIGFLKDVTFTSNLELEALKTAGSGGPLRLRGKKAKEYTCQLKAQLFEVSDPNNMSLLLGPDSDPVAVGGAPITKTDQQFTFANYQTGGVQAVTLDGSTISGGADKPVVKNTVGSVTYVENTDYVVDYVKGIIYRNPGGTITAGQQVKVTYKYTPPTGYQIPLGKKFALARKPLVFEHLNEDDISLGPNGKITRITFWLAEPDGKPSFSFTDGSFVMPEITFDSIEDLVAHATEPFGRIEFAAA